MKQTVSRRGWPETFKTQSFNKVLGLKVSGQGKLEFESDLSETLIKKTNIDDFAKMLLPLQDGRRTCQKAYKSNEMLMFFTRPWRIGVGVVWPVVILRLNH